MRNADGTFTIGLLLPGASLLAAIDTLRGIAVDLLDDPDIEGLSTFEAGTPDQDGRYPCGIGVRVAGNSLSDSMNRGTHHQGASCAT